MKFIIKKSLITILIAFVFLLPVLSFAQQTESAPKGGTQTESAPKGGTQTESAPKGGVAGSVKIVNPIPGIDTIDGFIKTVLVGVIKIALPVVALAIIYSGFLFVTARGNPESLKKAKDALLYSVLGAAILLGAWAIAQLISDTVLKLG